MVAFDRSPAGEVYDAAVRSVVRVADARRRIRALGGRAFVRGAPRGLVGALAATAWPARRATWELIAYRDPPDRPREIDAASVRAAERRFPSLFQCWDPATRRLLVAPHTPCPILYGLRGTRAEALPRAMARVRSSPVARWVIFRTNQATGDHLVERAAGAIGPYEGGRVRGRVAGVPERRPGGHVAFSLTDPSGDRLDCLAFEPTKTLPRVAASLRPGDIVAVWGGRGRDATFRLEGIDLIALADRAEGQRPPRCPACGRAASSLGRARGYRCPECHRRFPPEAARPVVAPPEYLPGRYHPTPSARRHLHPLARSSVEPLPPVRRTRKYGGRLEAPSGSSP